METTVFPKKLVEHEALALARAAADRDDADGALHELQRRHRLGVHHELALLVAVDQPQRPRGPPAAAAAAVPNGGGGGGGARIDGARAPAAAEAKHLEHRDFADGKGSRVFRFKMEEGIVG